MGDVTVKRVEEFEAIYGGGFRRARAALGVESFGLAVLDLPPSYDGYPEHDHSEDGQEEVYVTLSGGGELEIEGERHPLDPEHVARVGSGVSRKVWPGEDGIRLLIIGGVPGGNYEPPKVSRLGEPDPAAAA